MRLDKFTICIWEEYPRRYPHLFYQYLRESRGIKLIVCYYDAMRTHGRQLEAPKNKLDYDFFIEETDFSLDEIGEWRKYIHIISGARSRFLRKMMREFIDHNVKWLNWGESYREDYKWIIKKVYVKWYAEKIQNNSLGSFCVSGVAMRQLKTAGVCSSKLYFLPYSYKDVVVSGCKKNANNIIRFAAGRRVFMYFGELSKRKAIDVLIRSYANLNCRNWVLVLVGKDIGEINVDKIILKYDLTNSVYVNGYVEHSDVGSVMELCDVFILPSRFDGWGAVLNEMASLSKPLIASDMCGAAEHLIQHGVNGYIVKYNDVKGLTVAMRKYTSDEALVKKHGLLSKEILIDFSVDKNSDRFINGLESMLDHGI